MISSYIFYIIFNRLCVRVCVCCLSVCVCVLGVMESVHSKCVEARDQF